IIKSILHAKFETSHITYKDTESYFGILYDGNTRKWICRLFLDSAKKSIVFPDAESTNGTRFYIESLDELYQFKDKLIDSVGRFVQTDNG
ncbi:MAG TPA: endonuclease, partial [Ruminiclostridium sp.]|nr:endonuclease [Ruminiclostridium sp.]